MVGLIIFQIRKAISWFLIFNVAKIKLKLKYYNPVFCYKWLVSLSKHSEWLVLQSRITDHVFVYIDTEVN